MSKRYQQEITDKMIYVFIELLNLDNEDYPRTQKEVAEILKMSKSTVSDNVKRLLSGEYIEKLMDTHQDIFYKRGDKSERLESQLTKDFIADAELLRRITANRGAIPSPISAEPKKPEPSRNYTVPIDADLSGSWAQFTVIKEGIIDNVTWNGHRVALFGPLAKREKDLPGQANYDDIMTVNGKQFKIRYQRGVNGKWFYVEPRDRLPMVDDSIVSDEETKKRLLKRCWPVLQIFENRAGWIFQKDSDGFFAGSVNAQVHYAISDPAINDAVKSITGGPFNQTNADVHADESLGIYEVEATKVGAVRALTRIQQTTSEVGQLISAYDKIIQRMDKVEKIMLASSEIVETLAKIQNAGVKLIESEIKLRHGQTDDTTVPANGSDDNVLGMYQ